MFNHIILHRKYIMTSLVWRIYCNKCSTKLWILVAPICNTQNLLQTLT